MSLGWPKVVNTANVQQAVADAVKQGVLIVAAAGNDRKDEPTYPCAFEGVLCVGAITNNGQLASFSNSGGIVDILAPGEQVISTYPSAVESQTLRIQGYETLSGTSQASPHIAAMAATLKSAYPGIGVNELRARLLLSGGALPSGAAALYGLANLNRALQAQPQPVFYPDFKSLDEAQLDESTLKIQGSINVQNLWLQASQVSAQLTVNGVAAGSAQATQLSSGAQLTVPWSYAFPSLDASSDVQLSLVVSASGVPARTFAVHFSAARVLANIATSRVMALNGTNGWIGNTNGHLFSRVNNVNSLPAETGLPRYYQPLNADNGGTPTQFFDGSSANPLVTVEIPQVQRVLQVIRVDMTGSATGLGGHRSHRQQRGV